MDAFWDGVLRVAMGESFVPYSDPGRRFRIRRVFRRWPLIRASRRPEGFPFSHRYRCLARYGLWGLCPVFLEGSLSWVSPSTRPAEQCRTIRSSERGFAPSLSLSVESVGKVPKQIFVRDVEKKPHRMPHNQRSQAWEGSSDPENLVLTLQKDFFYRLVSCRDMNELANRIDAELGVLIGQPIVGCWRAADMQIFEFGRGHRIVNRKGEDIEVSDLRLHVQCRWRFVNAERILFARDDLNYPADKRIEIEDFDWDHQESVLDVTQRAWFAQHHDAPPKVIKVSGDPYGGLRIELEDGCALEIVPCESEQGDYSELWRLLGHRTDRSHFVVTATGVMVKSAGVDPSADS